MQLKRNKNKLWHNDKDKLTELILIAVFSLSHLEMWFQFVGGCFFFSLLFTSQSFLIYRKIVFKHPEH